MLLRTPTKGEELAEMLKKRNLPIVEAELKDMWSCFEFYLSKNNSDLLNGLKQSFKTYKSYLAIYEKNPYDLVPNELVEAVPRLRAELSELEKAVEASIASNNEKSDRLYKIPSKKQNAKPRIYGKGGKQKTI